MIRSIARLGALIFLLSCSPGAFAADSLFTVVDAATRPGDDALRFGQRSFTGNDPAKPCAYRELLAVAENAGRKLGANLMRIDAHRERTSAQFCDEITVTFYKVANVQAYEQQFSWSADRKLEWTDFKGDVPITAASRTAAVTKCGIAIETSTTTSSLPGRVYVHNAFDTRGSWVRPEQRHADVLQHEQGHFDLCELYTRIMRQRFSKSMLRVDNLQAVVRDIYGRTMREYTDRQQQYEQETKHGIDAEAQLKWGNKIGEELAEIPAD